VCVQVGVVLPDSPFELAYSLHGAAVWFARRDRALSTGESVARAASDGGQRARGVGV
jgi:hypothetical protein